MPYGLTMLSYYFNIVDFGLDACCTFVLNSSKEASAIIWHILRIEKQPLMEIGSIHYE